MRVGIRDVHLRVKEQWLTGMGGPILKTYTGNGLYVGYE